MEFDAIIFDLDGTLADTLEDIADATERVLAAQGFPGHTYQEYRSLIGMGLRNLVTQALPAASRTDDIIAGSLERMLSEYGEHCLVKTRLYDGIGALVEALRARGARLAVLSNKADELTRRIVDGLVAPGSFAVVMGARDGVPLKPDPAGPLLVARRLGVPPQAVAFVGDSGIDMRTATAAGMIPVGVSWGLRGREELVESGARMVLDHPRELLALSLR